MRISPWPALALAALIGCGRFPFERFSILTTRAALEGRVGDPARGGTGLQ